MKKIVTFILFVLICICGYAQTIDPVLLEKMNQRSDNEKIRVFVIMRQQLDQQQLNRRAAHFTTRADRREFVVNELKQFAEASQYDLRHSLAEMQHNELVSEPKTLWIANAIYFEATKDAILSLANRSDIMVIGFDEESNWLPDGEEARPAYPTREIASNVTQVNADQMWSLGYTGQGVVVAVIDTGVNYNHLDLADHLWDGGADFPYHGFDVYNNDNNPMDDHGHGTHCAGTVCGDGTAGSQTGMAPDATLMIVKCLGAGGSGTNTQVMSAMQWAVDHGCDVISMSLGGHGHSGAAQTLERNTCVNVLNAGVIAAIAAGNEGNKMGQYPIPDNIGLPGGCPPPYLDPEQEQNPGGLSCSVCVGAVDSNDQATSFTSHGPRDWSESDYADYPYTPGSQAEFGLIRPDVCAPGAYIKSADYSSNNGYTTMSGTSMATPCVAGCMALILSKDIETTPADVCRILEETAVPLSTGKSNIYGYGRVDVLAAINAMYSGPLRLDSFTVNDGQGNNDGKLNAGESVMLNLTITNGSDLALDGATMVLSSQSEYVTITNGTSNLPHFGVGQTRTINNMFSFNLSNDAPAKRMVQFMAEIYVNGESVGVFRFGILVYGHILRFVEVTVSNDSNGDGMLEPGESANLHVTVLNAGNEPASSVVGSLSTTYPYLVINSNNISFGTIEVNGQAFADFNVSLTGNAPTIYTIGCSLDLVDVNQKHTNVDFELWRKAITLTSNPEGGGTLSGGGYYGQGQSCTISASANPGYAFEKWTLDDGTAFSCLPTCTFEVTGEAEYVANFQAVTNGVVIGDGAGTHDCLPSYSYYCYTLSQQIYTANELNLGACDISNVSFFNAGTSKTRNFKVYMVNTSKTAFDSNTDWITVTDADQVFSGSVSLSNGSWTTLYFDTPFSYDGSSNVALIVDDNTGNWYYNNMSCRVSSTDNCQALCVYSDVTNFEPNSPNNYSGTQLMVKNHIIFGVASYDYTVTVSANPANGGTVSGGGLYYYNQQATLTATANDGYVFSNWTKNGEVVSYVSKYPVSVTESADYVANFELAPDGIVIGDGTYTNAYLPTYYYYSLSEQIYTANEMGGTATEISSVSFFNTGSYGITRSLNVYMVNTDKTSFDSSTDWIPVSENDLVFSGNVTMTARSWVTIYFNTPFNYDGFSNVALIVDDNTSNYNLYTSCRTFDTETSQAIRISGSDTNYDPYAPAEYTGTLMSVKNQVVFGIPSYDYTVTVSASPAEGGSASGTHGGYYFYGQPVTLTATPNEGYVFNYWTKNGEIVSYLSNYVLEVSESAEYVAVFQQVDGIVIGNATNTNAYLPTYYYYSLSEQIYTANEMGGTATEISSVSFFNTGSYGVTRNMDVYMVNTDKTSFDSSTDWIPVSENDLVFSGNVTITARSWVTIYFNTPFNYDGSSNVALIVDDNSNNYNAYTSCRTFDTETSQAIRIYSSGTNYDPYAPTDYTGTLMSVKNQIIFGIPSYDYTVTVSASPAEGGSVSGGGPCYLNQPITLTATANPGYVFSNWTKNGEVVSYVSKCTVSVTESTEYVANFELAPDGIVIGDGTYTNAYLPTYYYYSLSEQIYTASEMGGVATEISSVSFFNTGSYGVTRNMNVYMVNTSKTSFESTTDWIPVSENDLVFSGNVTMTARSWVTIYFNTPFSYDGSSNVALIVDDNSNNYNAYTSCRTFDTETSQAIRIYSSGMNYDPYAPTGFIGTLMSVKNQVIFGTPSYDYTVTVSASPAEGGSVSGTHGGYYFYGQPVTLTATPNEGYVFNYWTKNGEIVSCLSNYVLAVTESAEYVANFQEVTNGFVIGDAISTNAYLPTYYYYSLSEQIYTSAEMGDSPCQISNVSFFNTRTYNRTRNMSIYMVNTDKTSFESTSDWIAVSDDDLVFSGNVVFPAHDWATICFSTPFNYDGVSNIVLIVDDNSNSYNTYTSCRTFGTEGNQVLCISSSGTDYDPYAPSGYTGTLMSEKNQVIFRLPSVITATANLSQGGTISGAGSYAYGATCTLTATPNAGYYFLNWTEDGEVISYDGTYSFTVEGDRNLVANFVEGGSTCMIAFDLHDSFGDGWNGNYLVVDFGNGTSEQFTIESGSSASYSRVMDTDSHITLSWISGSFIGECSFDVRFDNGVLILHKSGLSASYQQELTINCVLATVPHSITAVANPEEGGTVEGAGTYDGGTVITMTAMPNDGYTFCYWEENGQQVSTDAEYTFTVTADRNLVARFSLPLAISVTSNMPEGGTTTNGGMFYYGNTCTLTAIPNNGYLFQNWSKNGEVVSCNATYNFTVTESAEVEAVFMLLEGTLVGQGETTNQNLPSYSYYNYTLSQQIYTMQEIGDAGNITSISFYNGGTTKTRKFDIYLVHTDKTTFESATDWITVTEGDRVFSGNVNMTQGYWTTLILDTPFAYNGTSNLAVIVDDNMGSWSSGMACRVFNANGYQAIRICSDNTNYDPFNPSEYSGTRYTVKNQIIFGLSSTCHFITAGNWSQASNWSGGTMPEANDEVFIDASCQLDMNATVASLTVSDGQSLTLQSGQTLTVTNTLTNTVTTGLVIEDGAQLVHASENVSAMVKKNIAGHGTSNGRYYLISNPLTTVVDPEMSSVYHLITGDYDLYDWLPSAPDSLEWRNIKDNLFVMSPDGYGYLYANRNDVELKFPGILKPSHNRYAKSVSYDSNDIEHPGWNLIGNPFVCNAYLVDEEGNPLPFYRMNAAGDGFEAVAPGTPIAPMEGVFYKASGNGTVYFIREN